MTVNKADMLLEPMKFNIMRAPTDNERSAKNLWYKYTGAWNAEGFDKLFNKCYSCTCKEIKIRISLQLL